MKAWILKLLLEIMFQLFLMCYSLGVVARNEAYQTLVKRKPQATLIESSILFSVFGHIIIQFVVQLLAFIMLIAQPW